MISRGIYEEVIFQAIAKGATTIAPDIRQGFEQAIQRESRLAAKEGLEKTYAFLRRYGHSSSDIRAAYSMLAEERENEETDEENV